MNQMKIPGFTAGATLYRTLTSSRTVAMGSRSDQKILPQLPINKNPINREKCTPCKPDDQSPSGYSETCCLGRDCEVVSCTPYTPPPSTPPYTPPPVTFPPANTSTGTYCAETVERLVGHRGDGTPVFGYSCRTQKFTEFAGRCSGSPFADPSRFHTECVTGAGITQCCYGWHAKPWIFASDDGSVRQGCSFCLW
jgi:hypothetical protein